MTRKILMLTMLLAIAFFALPIDSKASNDTSARERSNAGSVVVQKRGRGSKGRRWKRNKGRNRYYGYKNYGQYRRTQVGNRRYRLVRRYYWRDGIRLSRWVRLYY